MAIPPKTKVRVKDDLSKIRYTTVVRKKIVTLDFVQVDYGTKKMGE
jgi:hypothetical protein